ncbi:MAG: hypothetical protein R2711_18090 [Acidimicrobiales bacterium]
MVSAALIDRTYRPSADGFSREPTASALYAAFAHLRPSEEVAHCPHCVPTEELALLAGPGHNAVARARVEAGPKAGTTRAAPTTCAASRPGC